MKIKEIRDKQTAAIELEMKDLQKHLFDLRTQAVTEKLENPSLLRKTRKDIAKMKTILREAERLKPSRVVIDSLSELRLLAREPLRYRRQLMAFKKFFAGRGSISGPGQVLVTPSDGGEPYTLTGRNIIIDTGTRPRPIKDLPFDGKRIINSDDAVVLEELPESFIIRGGGAVGV